MKTPAAESGAGPHTAIVVGSGCSVGLGVPVMKDFLDTLIDKLSKPGFYDQAPQDLAAILAFITRVKGSAAYVKAELLNIEELYGMADMDEDLWNAAGRPSTAEWYGYLPAGLKDLEPVRVKKALNRAIFHLAEPAGKEFLTKRRHFPTELEDLKRESATETLVHSNRGTRWTNLLAYLCLASFKDRNGRHPLFVQFNWDLALDRALYRRDPALYRRESFKDAPVGLPGDGWPPWYGNESDGRVDYEKCSRLARPHGGINWVNNGYGRDGTMRWLNPLCRLVKARWEECLVKLYPKTNEDVWADTSLVLDRSACSGHKPWSNGDCMEIVPPTWRKQATKPVYEAQWGHISQGLQSVRRIVFIGYSLPKTDLYFRHFLALSLADNPHLPKVYVLNPGIQQDGDVRENYLDLFAPLAKEGRLYGIDGRFGDPALFDLHRALAVAQRIDR